jgi:hypothetical protein
MVADNKCSTDTVDKFIDRSKPLQRYSALWKAHKWLERLRRGVSVYICKKLLKNDKMKCFVAAYL